MQEKNLIGEAFLLSVHLVPGIYMLEGMTTQQTALKSVVLIAFN